MKYNKDILDRFINEKVVINVETQQEWNDFMKLLEKETECRWRSGETPTYFENWRQYQEESSVVFNFDGRSGLEFGTGYFYKEKGRKVVKYKVLIKGEETMTNIEKVNKALANANEDKIKEVLDFLGYKEDGKFIPGYGEKYYAISTLGGINSYNWVDDENDNHILLMNNVYRTEEEAEQVLDFQTRKAKLIKEIEDSSEPIDWDNENQTKYCIWLSRRRNSLRMDSNIHAQTQGTTYTTNEQFLKELIKERSDEVKELLFGIK